MVLPPDDAKKLHLKGSPDGNPWAKVDWDPAKNPEGYTGRDALYKSLTAIVGSAAYQKLTDAAKFGLVSLVPPTTDISRTGAFRSLAQGWRHCRQRARGSARRAARPGAAR